MKRLTANIVLSLYFWIVVPRVPTLEAAPQAGTPVPDEYFGMHFISREDASRAAFGALGKGTLVAWPYLERSRGKFDWRELDGWVSLAERLNVDLIYTFGAVPYWAASDSSTCVAAAVVGVRRCGSMPADIGDWDTFVRALVTRYRGRITYYELWNEPDYSSISPEQMARLTNRARKIILSVDPTAKIISISLNGRVPKYADAYFSAGGPTDVDVVSFHAYPSIVANVPEAVDRNYSSSGSLLAPLLPVLSKFRLESKPLWDTEGSWSDRVDTLSPQEKAAFISRDYLLHWSNGIGRFYWYAWDHPWIGRLQDTVAGGAYMETRKWMLGAVMDEPCKMDSNGHGTWTCGFTRPGNYRALAVWSTRAPTIFRVPSGFSQYRDLSGQRKPVTGPVVPIGIKPILLETGDPMIPQK